MASGKWLIPGYDRDMALIDHYDDELQTRLGKYYKLAGEIEGFYVTNPSYVWFRDNGLAGGLPARLEGLGLWRDDECLLVEGDRAQRHRTLETR